MTPASQWSPTSSPNAGGITVSYCEWTQNIQQFSWTEERVNDELGHIMRRAYRQVRDRAGSDECDLRRAAFVIGVDRVANAAHQRGYV